MGINRIEPLKPEYVEETRKLINSNFEKKIKIEFLVETINHKENATFLLLSKENEVVATVGIREKNRICWLCTKYKKRGYAIKLMNYIIKVIENPYLYVKCDNIPAITLYKSQGFGIEGIKENSFLMRY